jgi:hypothetical protein
MIDGLVTQGLATMTREQVEAGGKTVKAGKGGSWKTPPGPDYSGPVR